MCLGSGRSSKPALRARTTPAVTPAPADESAKTKQKTTIPAVQSRGQTVDTARNWDDVDAASPSKAQGVSNQISDSGINY